MNITLLYILTSVLLVSFISFVGIFFIAMKEEKLRRFILFIVSFATGALLGGTFLHLLPETVKELGFTTDVGFSVLFGIIMFFIIEKFIKWRHCHIPTSDKHPHPFAYMNLIGDGVHNFIDGIIIAASYITSIPLGITTTFAVVLHEIPQEIGDFGVLIHGGFEKRKALILNFITALTAVLGAFFTLFLMSVIKDLIILLLPFTAGGFLYIASSDLIPELQKECEVRKSAIQLIFLVLGMAIMFGLMFLE